MKEKKLHKSKAIDTDCQKHELIRALHRSQQLSRIGLPKKKKNIKNEKEREKKCRLFLFLI